MWGDYQFSTLIASHHHFGLVPQTDMASTIFSSLAASRLHGRCSMKSCATGLSVRFFSVTMPIGTRAAGSSTGKTLISARLVGNLNAEAGIIVRDRPVARRLIRASGEMVTTVTRGSSSAAGAKSFHCNRPSHAFRRWQYPRFTHQFGKLDLAPPNPWILHARHNDVRVLVEDFDAKLLICDRAECPCDQEINVTLAQLTVQRVVSSGHEMKHDTRIALGEPIDDGTKQSWRSARDYIRSALPRPQGRREIRCSSRPGAGHRIRPRRNRAARDRTRSVRCPGGGGRASARQARAPVPKSILK